jgi:hypothetical protein
LLVSEGFLALQTRAQTITKDLLTAALFRRAARPR